MENSTDKFTHMADLLKGREPPSVTVKLTYTIGDYKWMDRKTLIDYVRWRINRGREGTNFKPLSYVAIQQKVKHLDDWDLKFFIDRCEKAKNFGSTFFYELKVK